MAEKHLTDGTTALAAQPRVIKIEAAEKPQNAQLRVSSLTLAARCWQVLRANTAFNSSHGIGTTIHWGTDP